MHARTALGIIPISWLLNGYSGRLGLGLEWNSRPWKMFVCMPVCKTRDASKRFRLLIFFPLQVQKDECKSSVMDADTFETKKK